MKNSFKGKSIKEFSNLPKEIAQIFLADKIVESMEK